MTFVVRTSSSTHQVSPQGAASTSTTNDPASVVTIPSRFGTPSRRRAALEAEAAQKVRERRVLDEARSIAMHALRVLKEDMCAGRSTSPNKAKPLMSSAMLLSQIREEENRILGSEAASTRSASRSRSPPPSARGRPTALPINAFHSISSKLSVDFHSNAGKAHPRSVSRPFKVSRDDLTVPLAPHFDPHFDSHVTPVPGHSELSPFFSAYVPGVKATQVLPERYVVPIDQNPKLKIRAVKIAERDKIDHMKLLHPPKPHWDYWENIRRRKEKMMRLAVEENLPQHNAGKDTEEANEKS